jgi:hypothetical protein
MPRRRLPVVMVRLKMAENLKEAVTFIEQVLSHGLHSGNSIRAIYHSKCIGHSPAGHKFLMPTIGTPSLSEIHCSEVIPVGYPCCRCLVSFPFHANVSWLFSGPFLLSRQPMSQVIFPSKPGFKPKHMSVIVVRATCVWVRTW